MPAHIAKSKYVSAAGTFVAQALPFKYQPRATQAAVLASKHHNKNWVSPAFAASIPDQHRITREHVYSTYDDYRRALDNYYVGGAKQGTGGNYPWFKGLPDFNNLMQQPDPQKHTGDKKMWDVAGFQHFKDEWDLYLKKDTCFDFNVRARFLYGETVTLINRSSEVRAKQLKRIEANTAHGTIVIWSIH